MSAKEHTAIAQRSRFHQRRANGGALIGELMISPSRNPPADRGALGFGEIEAVTGAEEDGAGARQLECSNNAFTKENDIRRRHRC